VKIVFSAQIESVGDLVVGHESLEEAAPQGITARFDAELDDFAGCAAQGTCGIFGEGLDMGVDDKGSGQVGLIVGVGEADDPVGIEGKKIIVEDDHFDVVGGCELTNFADDAIDGVTAKVLAPGIALFGVEARKFVVEAITAPIWAASAGEETHPPVFFRQQMIEIEDFVILGGQVR